MLDATGTTVTTANCDLVVNSVTNPSALLKGQISLDNQRILTGEPIRVSYSVANVGNVDVEGLALTVQTVGLDGQTIYQTVTDQANLPIGTIYSSSGQLSTQGYSAKDYLVVLRAGISGTEETLASAYFRVEGAPTAPALAGPANGSDITTLTPALAVSDSSDPNNDNLTYEFEIYQDSGLTSLITSGTATETTSITRWTVPRSDGKPDILLAGPGF